MSSQIATFDVIQEAPNFSWSSGDPASNGFTKHGSATTQADPSGWLIDTLTGNTNAQTYYSKDNWPNAAFVKGLTLVVLPPIINGSDGSALPNKSVTVAIDDGSNRYELTFDAFGVKLNGGTYRNHRNLPVKLVIAVGGGNAALWMGTTTVESTISSIASVSAGLTFGDFATTDDSSVVWISVAYSMSIATDRIFSIVPSQTVKVYDVDHSTGLSNLTDSDNDGYYPNPTILPASGTLVRTRIESYQGMSAYTEQRSQ